MANEDVANTRVVILTSHYLVIGDIALVPGARLTDYIDEAHHFIAVTDAEVRDRHTQNVLMRSRFMDLNRESVEIILPAALAEWESCRESVAGSEIQ